MSPNNAYLHVTMNSASTALIWRNPILHSGAEMIKLTEVKILKEGIKGIVSYGHDFPVNRPQIKVYNWLTSIYTSVGRVFAGKVEEFVALGGDLEEKRDLGDGLEVLQAYGLLTIENGIFTPTDIFLEIFVDYEPYP